PDRGRRSADVLQLAQPLSLGLPNRTAILRALSMANSRTGRNLTLGLLILQLAGCVVDFGSGNQSALWPAVCMVSSNVALGMGGLLIWTLLSSSWILGLAALRWIPLRPVYWIMIRLSALAYLAHHELLERGVFSCDVF